MGMTGVSFPFLDLFTIPYLPSHSVSKYYFLSSSVLSLSESGGNVLEQRY